MSRVGEKPVPVPAGVTVAVSGRHVSVRGPRGELAWDLPANVEAKVDGQTVFVSRLSENARKFHGLSRSLIANMVTGVSEGYTKNLEIQGVGFRGAVQDRTLSLSLGFASPIEFVVPVGIEVTVNNNTEICVSGADKQQVGEIAARIRAFYPAEPYKGKGVRYKGERVRRKVGKTVA